MSAEVQALLGPEMAARAGKAPLANATCPVCARQVPPAGPVNVLATAGQVTRVVFAHVGCAPSLVLSALEAAVPDLPDEGPMTMRAALVEHGRAVLPVLVAEVPVQVYALPPSGSGEATDAVVAALLRHGLSLICRVGDAPRAMLDWTAVLGPPSGLLIRRPPTPTLQDPLFYEGKVHVPAGWLDALEAYGWCVLYSGTHLADPATDRLTTRSLRAAAASGTLVGARLRVTDRTSREPRSFPATPGRD